jgi:uncharacterized membrane protein
MDILSFLKFVHVVAALAWVGGGLSLVVLGNLLLARGDRRGALAVVSLTAPLGGLWFLPAALITLLSGASLFWLGAWRLDGWSVTALAMVAVAFGIGIAISKPAGDRVADLVARGQTEAATAQALRLVHLGRFDASLMVAIVALMVLKPSFADIAVLGSVIGGVAIVGLCCLTARDPALS